MWGSCFIPLVPPNSVLPFDSINAAALALFLPDPQMRQSSLCVDSTPGLTQPPSYPPRSPVQLFTIKTSYDPKATANNDTSYRKMDSRDRYRETQKH